MDGTNNEKAILTPKELAKYLGLHLVTVYRLIKKGDIPVARIGGQWRFHKPTIDKWIEKNIRQR